MNQNQQENYVYVQMQNQYPQSMQSNGQQNYQQQQYQQQQYLSQELTNQMYQQQQYPDGTGRLIVIDQAQTSGYQPSRLLILFLITLTIILCIGVIVWMCLD